MKSPAIGTRLIHRVQPQPGDLASAIGNVGVDVVSTPAIIGYLETAAHLLIESAYEAGEASVGTRVNVEHLAPANVDSELVCQAELIACDRGKCEFAVRAVQNGRLIMQGEHTRRVIDLQTFLERGDRR